jgi:hypothetical protein
MIAAVIALGALAVIGRDLLHPQRSFSVWLRIVRATPFVVIALLSLWTAAKAPQGRHPFQVDLSLSAEDLARSMTKLPHLKSIAVLFLVAVIAFGAYRVVWAFTATMLVGAGWEIAEATVVGHHARLADLAPNIASGVACLVLVATIRRLLARHTEVRTDDGPSAA